MHLCRSLIATTLFLFTFACSASGTSDFALFHQAIEHKADTDETIPPNAAVQLEKSAASARPSSNPSLCGTDDQIVFSCPMVGSTKIASMCATQSKSGAEPTFYYAFGHTGAPELRFPALSRSDNASFTRSHLMFAGNTGGYAYSFHRAGYKYIVYSISGERSLRDGGVIVQPLAKSVAATKLACRSTAITETSDDQLIDATLRLKRDPQIESRGLPEAKQASFSTSSL